MGSEEDRKLEEGFEQVICNEGYGIGEVDSRDEQSPGSDEEAIVAVTREVRNKGVLSNLGRESSSAVKWIIRYFKGTSSVSLQFGSGKTLIGRFY